MGLLKPDAPPDPLCFRRRWKSAKPITKLLDLKAEALVDSNPGRAATPGR
jgi:hypothetical protein